ncbi:MAG TPA: DnaD domain-containing protein [Bacilli bacterium]
MIKHEGWKQGLIAGMQEGTVAVPNLLLKYYHKLKLSEAEAMLFIHFLAFREKEQKDFPTIEELQSRMSATPDKVIAMLQKLMRDQLLGIDEEVDEETGIQYERYNLNRLHERIAECWIEERAQQIKGSKPMTAAASEGKDVFSVFEKEFARPLSPMECENISKWLDNDKYSTELIFAALKEAVFAGKVHFRYIDRILLDWERNRIFTVEQAKEHAQKFRGVSG